jgi:Type VI secretion system (T6SS), amidase effector protein 4
LPAALAIENPVDNWACPWEHNKKNKKREAVMGVIPASFNTLSRNYPRRDQKNPQLYQYVDKVMKGLEGTPCCVQMSHALNMAGIPVPPRSYRRDPNPKLTINKKDYYYLLATDELETFLTALTGDDGETINRDLGKTRTIAETQSYIQNRTGIIIFRHANLNTVPPKGKFEHTELWDGTQILQRDISTSLFACPRVLMWDTNDPAKWLGDYMKTRP